MFETYLPVAALLLVAFLFGGMLLFSAAFATFLYKHLHLSDIRMLLSILTAGVVLSRAIS